MAKPNLTSFSSKTFCITIITGVFLITVVWLKLSWLSFKAEAFPAPKMDQPEIVSCECKALGDFDISRATVSRDLAKRMKKKELAKFYYTSESIMDEVKKLSRTIEFTDFPEPAPGSTCVVVGSGGILLNYPSLGEKIDSYDFVMRSNLPQTKGYEMYVGSKTSVNLCYWSSAKRAAESGRELNNTHLIYGGCSGHEFENVRKLVQSNDTGKLANMFRTSKFLPKTHYIREWLKNSFWKELSFNRPSAGLEALAILSHWCPTPPDFAGLGWVRNKTVPYHYFDKSGISQWHSPDDEIEAIRRLKKCNLIGNDLTSVIF